MTTQKVPGTPDWYGVHQGHCCLQDGCKYSHADCPVVSGEVEQEYPCEYCGPKNLPGSLIEAVDAGLVGDTPMERAQAAALLRFARETDELERQVDVLTRALIAAGMRPEIINQILER